MNCYSVPFPNILEINAFDASHEQPSADKQQLTPDRASIHGRSCGKKLMNLASKIIIYITQCIILKNKYDSEIQLWIKYYVMTG